MRRDVPEVVLRMEQAEIEHAPPSDRLALQLAREYYRQLSEVTGKSFRPAPLSSMRRRRSWRAFMDCANLLLYRGWQDHAGNYITAQFKAREHSRPGKGVFPNELPGPVAQQRFERFLQWGAAKFAGESAVGFSATADEQLADQLIRDHYKHQYVADCIYKGDVFAAAECEPQELGAHYLIALSVVRGTDWLLELPQVGAVIRARSLIPMLQSDAVKWAAITQFAEKMEKP